MLTALLILLALLLSSMLLCAFIASVLDGKGCEGDVVNYDTETTLIERLLL